MAFYEEISKYYDYIFPIGEEQLDFIKKGVGEPPKRLLDAACGSGGYSVSLAKQGYRMVALDYDMGMVRLARNKAEAEKLDIQVVQCDMKKLSECVKESFDGIFCIGNSIVHLGSHAEIQDTLAQMHGLLREGGKLVLQIINYDRIIKYGINELPAITNSEVGLQFIRKYEYDEEKGIIHFVTTLTIDKNDEKERYDNSIELLPLVSTDMEGLLRNAGFDSIKFYGDFKGSEYSDASYMLVVEATK